MLVQVFNETKYDALRRVSILMVEFIHEIHVSKGNEPQEYNIPSIFFSSNQINTKREKFTYSILSGFELFVRGSHCSM